MKKANIKQLATDNIVIMVLILLVVGFSIGNATFLKPANVINLFGQMCLNAILATGLTYVIILGGIDISVGSAMAITGILAAKAVLALGAQSTAVIIVIQIVVGVAGGSNHWPVHWMAGRIQTSGTYDLYSFLDAGFPWISLHHLRRRPCIWTSKRIFFTWRRPSDSNRKF